MQNDLPPLPEMKPVPAAPASTSHAEPVERPAPRSQYGAPSVMPFGRRLRQMVGFVMGGGLIISVGIAGLELVAKPGLRPTDLIGTLEARPDLVGMNQKLGVEAGRVVFTEADYRQKLANAERKGQAAAELDFQKKLVVVQADKERIVQAYSTLYQRANMIAQAAIQLEALAQQFRQQLLTMSNGGRSTVIMIKDLLCGFTGDQETCDSAKNDRHIMIDESDELSRGDVSRKVKEALADIEDPATIAVHRDGQRIPTFGISDRP